MMDSNEYDKLGLPEAEVTFHRGTGVDGGTTFVTVTWEVPAVIGYAQKKGFKFQVSSEIMDRLTLDPHRV